MSLLWGEISRERGSKTKVILRGGGGGDGVTGLAFKGTGKSALLYVSTVGGVVCFNVAVRDKEVKAKLDTVGCEKGEKETKDFT